MSESENLRFSGSEMFQRNKNLKIYRITDKNQSGEILHSHDYIQIWYVSKGKCEHWIEGRPHGMISGEAFVLPPDVPHKTILQPHSEIIGCEFNLENFFMDARHKTLHSVKDSIVDLSFTLLFFPEMDAVKPKYAFQPQSQVRVEEQMRRILEEYEADKLYANEILQLEILQLLLLFAREYKSVTQASETHDSYVKYRETVRAAIEYVDHHYSNPMMLDEICKRFAISKTYFCFLFKTLTGCTFVEYLVRARLNRAKQMLLTPESNITDIAYEVGFNDLSHFSRTFKKRVGLSPREYRTMNINPL